MGRLPRVLGIIAEYNPFHNGHLYHIKQSISQDNSDCVVCVISGNFVQRGNTSIIDKWTKTKMAIANGADLVIELPTVYSTSSAENFAEGAIKILDELGVVDSISFGMEAKDISTLNNIAIICFSVHMSPGKIFASRGLFWLFLSFLPHFGPGVYSRSILRCKHLQNKYKFTVKV